MLSREDSRRLAELERQLQRDDPEFCARMAGGPVEPVPAKRPLLPLLVIAAVLWLAAVVLGVLGWWIPAVIAALIGTVTATVPAYRLIRRRTHRA